MINMRNLALLGWMGLTVAACSQSGNTKNEGTTTVAADTAISTESKDQIKNDSSRLVPAETAFIQQAATGGMMEVEMGNLTTQKTKDPKVMAFAKTMIADHTVANQQLEQIAKGLGVKLPSVLPAAEQSHLSAMRQVLPEDYDKGYMDMMVADHAKTIDLFNGAKMFKNEELRSFALKTLPTLQQHNKMAIALDTVLKTKKPDGKGLAPTVEDQKK